MDYSKSKSFIISLAVYPFDVMFSVNQSDKEFSDSLRKALHEEHYNQMMTDACLPYMESSGKGQARTIRLRSGQTVVRFNHWDGSPQMHGVLAHEIFHVVEFLFRRIEIGLSPKSDEAWAYLLGYITEEFHKQMNGNARTRKTS